MTPADMIARLQARFGAAIPEVRLDTLDPWFAVLPERLIEVATHLRDDAELRFDMLANLSGVDYHEPDPAKAKRAKFQSHIEIVYHLFSVTHRHRLTMKVMLPRWKGDQVGQLPECPSTTGVWAIANWHERETFDLFGVRFTNHPDLTRILCPEDWEGHALRKDYVFPEEYQGIRGV